LEWSLKPLFRSAENGRIHTLANRKPDTDKTSGVRFGFGGMGDGSGFGPEVTLFNKDLFGRGIDVEVPLLYTYSQYQLYEFKASVPLTSQQPEDGLRFNFGAAYGSRARDDFFGIGNQSLRIDERQVRLVRRAMSAGVTKKTKDQWTASLQGVYQTVGVTEPTTGWSAQDHFSAASIPGLFGATLASGVLSLAHDTETRQEFAFRGGVDRFEMSFNRSVRGEEFGYWRYHFDSHHFFPLTSDGRKAIAVRGFAESNQTTDGRSMPFFEMPFVGSGDTMRGFENFRFQDKNALVGTVEYRYRIWPRLDWGLFLDEGQVAPRVRDFALDRFHTGYGVRLFVWPSATFPISFDLGHSGEAWRLYVNFNAKF
jgi:outer membrane protein assembly factor BamA